MTDPVDPRALRAEAEAHIASDDHQYCGECVKFIRQLLAQIASLDAARPVWSEGTYQGLITDGAGADHPAVRMHQEIETRDARIASLEAELNGCDTLSGDPVVSLGLRKCLELQRDTIALLEQERDSLRDALGRARSERDTFHLQFVAMQNKAEALRAFVQHKPECPQAADEWPYDCTCGLSTVLAQLPQQD